VLIAGFTILVTFVAGEAMARSRAALGLSIVALFGAFAIAAFDRKRTETSDRQSLFGLTTAKLMIASIGLGVMFVIQYALYRILDRFGTDPLEDARIPFARNTFEAATAFLPFGSGLGTFVPVYGMFEKPADAIANKYANHAHNDILQLWLDTGVIGLALMGAFAVWLSLRSVQIWHRTRPHGALELDLSLARAASLAIALIVVHSFVDYPLRTGAMMALFAFLCAILVEPFEVKGAQGAEPDQGIRQRTRRPARLREDPAFATHAPPAGRSAHGPKVAPRPGEWRSADIEWPDAWRQSAQSQKTPGPPEHMK
jgi:O-antigen ligase